MFVFFYFIGFCFFLNVFIYYSCVCIWRCGVRPTRHREQGQVVELVLSLYLDVGSRNRTQVTSLCSQHFYLLGHITSPFSLMVFKKSIFFIFSWHLWRYRVYT